MFVALCALACSCIHETRSLAGESRSGTGGVGGAGGYGGSGGIVALGSRETCETCTSDSDCVGEDHRCVQMDYLEEPFPNRETGFCLRIANALPEGSASAYDCEPPYVTVLVDAPSLSGGELDSYCGIRQELTTCPAVRAHEEAWSCAGRGDAACPEGGFCDEIKLAQWEWLCTYACDDVSQCAGPGGEKCSDYYCGW